MAFNSNRNTKTKINTSTKYVQMYNENAGDDSGTISLGAWNTYATININPMLDKANRVDGRVYDYDKTANVLLDINNIFQLRTGIKLLEKDVLAEKKGDKRKITSIAVRSQSVVVKVGTAGEYDGIDNYYIALFSLNTNGEVDGNAFYVFANNDNELMLNYDEDTNTSKNKNINTQWEAFKAWVEYNATNILKGGAHGANANTDYQLSNISGSIETIKALVENMMSGNGGSSNSSSNGGFQKNSGFGGARRRRSSTISLSEDDIDMDIEDEVSDVDDVDTDDIDETPTTSTKKTKKTTSKKSSSGTKKTTKKISVDDIAADMEDELDDMDDLD